MGSTRKHARNPSSLSQLNIAPSLRAALEAARQRLSARFQLDRLVLFGSHVSGHADEESDADLLIVLRDRPDHQTRYEISRLILDINLEFDSNLSELVVARQDWDHGPMSAMPIYREIQSTGFRL